MFPASRLNHLVLVTLTVSLVLHPSTSPAQWQPNGLVISAALNDQLLPGTVSDGAGGAIVTWQDTRSGNYDIYAQRVNAAGIIQWTTGGVALCTDASNQYSPSIAPDGAGGAMVTWQDDRHGVANSDVYAQFVNAAGVVQWTTDGVALCTAADLQGGPAIASDGSGGWIVTFSDYRNRATDNADIYAQRVSATGVVQWTIDGVALCIAGDLQRFPKITSDGSGGAIVTWEDNRASNFNIYAQRVNVAGVVQWTPNGVALCTAAGTQTVPTIASDGAGGAIVTWYDNRSGNFDIYAQRVNAGGAVQWMSDGAALCAAAGEQSLPRIASDGAGGAIVTWQDYRIGSNFDDGDIYAQRVSPLGVVQWTGDGVALCSAAGGQSSPTIVPDGAGGANVTWQDSRNGNSDIYTQRVSSSGAGQWTAGGVALCIAANDQVSPVIAPDGAGGAIVTWQDLRSGANQDIYAQRVGPNGLIPTGVSATTPSLPVMLGDNYPNPFSSGTAFDLALRHEADVNVEVFDAAGRRVRAMNLGRLHAGASRLSFNGLDDHAHALPSGVYFFRLRAAGDPITKKIVIAR